MSTFIMIIAVLAAVLTASATQPSCPEGGCKNFTIYLGPRWGNRIMNYPNYPKLRGPSNAEVSNIPPAYPTTRGFGTTERNDFEKSTQHNYYSHNPQSQNDHLIATHRPVPDGNKVAIDYTNEEENIVNTHSFSNYPYRVIPRARLHTIPSPFGLGTTKNPALANNELTVDMNDLYVMGVVNLTGTGITGEDLKQCLTQLSNVLNGDANMQVKRLYLSHNKIQHLPLLVFPVDLEYWLLELRLDNNPFYYIPTYTRFELSRLGNLKILSLAETGIRYLDSLYIPSLEVLDLSGNRLTSIPQSLESLHNLQELYLDDNWITNLFDSPLSSMRDLRVLSLARNQISQIWDSPFVSLNNLYKLYLNNNLLESLTDLNVHSGTSVYVGGNPLICSCPLLKQIQAWQLDIADRDNLTCYAVSCNRLRPVSSLREQDHLEDCPSRLERIVTHVKEAAQWFVRYHILPKVINVLLVLLVVIVLVLTILRRLGKAKRKVAPLEVPYNILDDKILT